MIKSINRFINFFIVILYACGILAAFAYNCKCDINFEGIKFSFELYELMSVITLIILIKLFFNFIRNLIISTFKKDNSDVTKHVIEMLQKELSYVLLKAPELAQKELGKIKKNIGDMPIVNWFQGNIYLLNNEENKAKMLFHEMSIGTKDPVIGLYGLYDISLKNKDKSSEKEALVGLLNSGINRGEIIPKLIALELLEKNFERANYFVDMLVSENSIRKNDVIATVKYVEACNGNFSNKQDILEQAISLSLNISKIVIAYADELVKNKNIKLAQKYLFNAWKREPNVEIFLKYVDCFKENKENLLVAADELVCARNDSWIGYFELAKILFSYAKYEDAFLNFLTVYGKNRSQYVVDYLIKTANMLPDPKSLSAQEILNGELDVKELSCYYACSNCGNESHAWLPICPNCHDIATLKYVEKY